MVCINTRPLTRIPGAESWGKQSFAEAYCVRISVATGEGINVISKYAVLVWVARERTDSEHHYRGSGNSNYKQNSHFFLRTSSCPFLLLCYGTWLTVLCHQKVFKIFLWIIQNLECICEKLSVGCVVKTTSSSSLGEKMSWHKSPLIWWTLVVVLEMKRGQKIQLPIL